MIPQRRRDCRAGRNRVESPKGGATMGFLDTLKAIFGGGGAASGDRDGNALFLYVRCDRCGDIVRVRVNMANELQQEFAESDGVAGYALRKGVVDSKCF